MSLTPHDLYRFDAFVLNRRKRVLVRNGAVVGLSPKGFDVLTYLVMNPGRVVEKEELLRAVWPGAFVEEGNLTQHISGLRKALGDRAEFIVTVPRQGYQFAVEVEPEPLVPGDAPPEPLVQTVRERARIVIEELPQAGPAAPPALAAPVRRRGWAVWASVAAALAVAVAALAGFAWWRHGRPQPAPVTAVLAQVANSTGDPALGAMLGQALRIDLNQSQAVDVLDEGGAASVLQRMGRGAETPLSYAVAREICERSNRQVVLSGGIEAAGSRYVLTLDGTDCRTGRSVAAAKTEVGSKEEVPRALDGLAEKVRRGLLASAASLAGPERPLRAVTTTSLEALRQYSIGKEMQDQGRRNDSTAAFQRAVDLDPQFALAYRELGVNNLYIGQNELAAQYFQRAFDLSGHVGPMEQLTVRATYYSMGRRDLVEAIKVYKLWQDTDPHDPIAACNLTDIYMQLGQWGPALAAGEYARQRFPKFPLVYENLSTIYRSLNRSDDAANAAHMAVKTGTGDVGDHMTLFDVALMQRDEAALARETAWFEAHDDGATVWYYPSFRGGAAAARGQLAEAERLYRRAYDNAMRANLPEAANGILMDEARAELELGYPAAARETLQRAGRWETSDPGQAELHAETGDLGFAEAYLAAHAAPSPDTLLTYVSVPRVRAAVALGRGKPEEAVRALEPARPYEMRDYTVPWLRGTAYLQLGQAAPAEAEFGKIVDNPGINPTCATASLGHLGLARAYALGGKKPQARREYETLFALWKNADPNLPALQQARAEYQRL
jgi:DNA-binding winged helix-turn-helix (wHTH) protein/tetratricopeptide (TPR) repeat protein